MIAHQESHLVRPKWFHPSFNDFGFAGYKRALFDALNASVAEECDGERLVALNFADGSRLALS